MIPKRRVRQKMGVRESAKVSCPSHARWVRGFECLGLGKVATDGPLRGQAHQCWGRIEAHHATTRGAGGGDDVLVPLCSGLHSQLDSPGWSQPLVERAYGLNFHKTAAELWLKSPHGRRYRADLNDMPGD